MLLPVLDFDKVDGELPSCLDIHNIKKANPVSAKVHQQQKKESEMNDKVKTTLWEISIMQDFRRTKGWVRLYIRTDCRRFSAEAKVYDLPDGTEDDYMGYGVREGSRVSKLSIRDLDHYPPLEIYNWDRGLDFDDAPEGLVDAIVDFCDSLPQIDQTLQEIKANEDYEDSLEQQETMSEFRDSRMRRKG